MQALSGSVGERGANRRHDVALVQALLVLTPRPPGRAPLHRSYLRQVDGQCGRGTVEAIRLFQGEQVMVSDRRDALFPRVAQSVPAAVAGTITPGDATWVTLVAGVPPAFAELRVLPGSRTPYLAAPIGNRDAAVTRAGGLTFEPNFRNSVTAVIRRMHQTTGIVCSVCRQGDRRSFDAQYLLLTSGRNVTHAGPGESNHNFGQGVDLGFERLRWLRPTGVVVENEDSWLHQLDPLQRSHGEPVLFWNALREAGTREGLFRGPARDRPHLQAWDDAGLDMAARLAALLSRVGTMRWAGRRQRYECDLGFGGRLFHVGSAAEIWSRQATVTVAMLNVARAQGGGPAAPATPQDVTAMRAALRADFDAADLAWASWTPS